MHDDHRGPADYENERQRPAAWRRLFVRGRAWIRESTSVEDPDDEFGAAVLIDRHAILVRQIPIMYAVLLVNVVTLAAMSRNSSSPMLWLALPIALSLVVARRLIYFARNRHCQVTPEDAAAQQRIMVARSVLLSVGYSIWVVSVLGSGDLAHDAIAAMLAYVSALGSAYCMATLPGSARSAVLFASAPVAFFLLTSGEPILMGLGVNLALAVVLALRLLTQHHLGFIEGVRSKLLLAQEGARAREAEEAAAFLARTDQLTGLLNRRGFLELLHRQTSHADGSASFALALLDLNGFKAVNDTYGHAAGDELLAAVASRMEASSAEGTTIARLGGDEFAILLGACPEGRPPEAIVHGMCLALAKPFMLPGDLMVSVSAAHGIAFFPSEEREPSRLLAAADRRLYKRKRAARARTSYPAVSDAGTTATVATDERSAATIR